MNNSDPTNMILLTATACREFVDLYYPLLQSRVDELIKMYSPDAIRCWNGNYQQGIEAIKNSLIELTPGKYQIITFDSQPVGDPNQSGTLLFIITGTVNYSDNPTNSREFYHQFIVSLVNGVIFIKSENFRLLR
ncbi:Nuclear transport factor [Entamoeba marina]